ncbi:MAG: hypothetical protein KJ621_01545 [Proteobacteria bacterium]|nr:hypothetical protein [Pseudomonadota bacterium]MBU1740092.1 hypothetical protein [Pseudomonadota bacterium]
MIDDMVSCVTGQKATEAAIRRWCELSGDGEVAGALSGKSALPAYRLGKYRVTMVKDGLIRYQTYTGRDRLVTGEACLVEGILFLNRTETAQASGDRDRFLSELKKLPKWNKTEYFSFGDQLKECSAANLVPPTMGRGRRILAEIGSARVPRKEDRDSEKQKPGPSVYSRIDQAESLIANLVKTTGIILKYLMLIIGQAAKALWPLLTRSSRWVWKRIRSRLRKN